MPDARDAWLVGDAYERFVGRWSRVVAREFVRGLDVGGAAAWLDVGCGTGGLTAALLELARPRSVTAVDPSAPFVEHAAARLGGAVFEVADARSLPFEDGRFDAVVSGLVLNFVPDPGAAVVEMRRVSRGLVAAYVWDYGGEMQLLRRFWDAAVALDPAARDQDEAVRFPLCRPEPLAELFEGAGLSETAVEAITIPTRFRDFDDLWQPFLGGQGPAPGYVASRDEADRDALRERLRGMVPVEADGTIGLSARAWAVRGLAPASYTRST